MPALAHLNSFFRNFFGRNRIEQDLDNEIRSHLELMTDQKIREGMNPQEAERAARIELGGIEQVKEEVRAVRAGAWFETVWQDIRFGVRMLRKYPGFTSVAVLTLALGIGANTAVFSVIDAVLLKPISAPDPGRVVVFMATNKLGSSSLASEIKFNVWLEQTKAFQDVSAYRPGAFNLTGIDQPQKVDAILVTGDYFHLFGLPIAQGRTFSADEERTNNGKVAVVSDTFWKRTFGGDPKTVGKTIYLNGDGYEVVGVLAQGTQIENLGMPNGPFSPEAVPDVWLPFPIDRDSNNQNHYFQAVGRLRPDVTLAMANAQLQLATEEFRRKFPKGLSTARGDVFSVQLFRDLLIKQIRPSLLMLEGAVAFVLLIACTNLVSLFLSRATTRKHEIAVRAAQGAPRMRIVRQLLTEAVLLSFVGAVLGFLVGFLSIHGLLALNPYNIPRIGPNASKITLDWRVFAFTVTVALMTGLASGLVPALEVSRWNLNIRLHESGDRATSFRQSRMRSLLVVTETALAFVVLIATFLVLRTLIAVRSVDPGFDQRNVVTTRTTLDPRVANATIISQIIDKAIQRVNDLPGVEATASTNLLPLEGLFAALPITVADRPLLGSPAAGHGNARFTTISPAYFRVLKVPILRGREFTDGDGPNATSVAIINEAMARKFWPDADPLRSQIFLGKSLGPNFDEPAREVVGIVADVHDDELDRDPAPAVFIPIAQRLVNQTQTTPVERSWLIRVRAPSAALNAAIEAELRQALGGLPVPPLRSMIDITIQSTARQEFNMRLLAAFGFTALVIAALGIFGVTAYAVRQRSRDMAIRMALGARGQSLLMMVITEIMKPALIGTGVGLAAALMASRLISSVLFGVKPNDPLTFIAVSVVLLGTALLACYIPARRATKVDPMVALRHE